MLTQTLTAPRATTAATTMRALAQTAYGGPEVLRLEDVAVPEIGDDEVLVRVHAAAVCRGDAVLMAGKPYAVRLAFGLRRPGRPIAGQQIAGRVVAIGKKVDTLRVGDEVFGSVTGGFAEQVRAKASMLVPKPARLTFEQAAAIPVSGSTALQALTRVGRLEAGQTLLIHGASGGVGTFAIQIAKALGAHVTAVASTRHVERLRALGADEVIDYTQADFARQGKRWDVMLDLVGNRTLADVRSVLQPKGTYLSSAGGAGNDWVGPFVWILKVLLAGLFGTQRMTSVLALPTREDMLTLSAMVDAGQLTPVIEHAFPLSDAVAAVAHVASGRAHGTTAITVAR